MTNSEAKATQRPWHAEQVKNEQGQNHFLVYGKNRNDGWIANCGEVFTDDIVTHENAENASLIIKAVNCHEALLEACRLAYDELGKDKRWNISDLRLKVLGQAIAKSEGR